MYNCVCCLIFLFPFCFHFCFCYQSASDGFWKSVATRVPREPHEIRILNPYFIQEAAFSFIGLPFNNGLMGRGVGIKQRKQNLREGCETKQQTRLTLFLFFLWAFTEMLKMLEGLWLCYSGSSQTASDPGKNLPDPWILGGSSTL